MTSTQRRGNARCGPLFGAAYVLMQELARQARHTDLRDAQVTRLRDRLRRLPVWVEESVRRVVLHLPASFLGMADWQRIAMRLGAIPPSRSATCFSGTERPVACEKMFKLSIFPRSWRSATTERIVTGMILSSSRNCVDAQGHCHQYRGLLLSKTLARF